MRQLLILAVLVLALVLGLTLVVVGQGSAYEFSDYDRQAAGLPPQTPQEQMTRQWERDQAQAQRNQQDQERAHNSVPQFNPRSYESPAPYNLYQNGRTSVCRRGANGAIFCQ